MDEWLDRATSLLVPGAGFEAACVAVSDYLSLRTYMVGPTLTLADLVVWGQLTGTSQHVHTTTSCNIAQSWRTGPRSAPSQARST